MPLHIYAENIVKDVAYEILMFRGSVRELQTHKIRFFKCLLYDAILLHARTIYEFMFSHECSECRKHNKNCNKHKNDARACQFFNSSEQWKPDKSKLCPYLSIAPNIRRINRALAHISYDRINGRYQWPIADISSDIETIFEYFLNQLPPDRRQWFNREINKKWHVSSSSVRLRK